MLGNLDFQRLDIASLSLVESLRAHPADCSVSFVDIEGGLLGGVKQSAFSARALAAQLSLAEPYGDGSFLVAAGDRLGVVTSDGSESWTSGLIRRGQRFNDGTVDSLGRLVVGSMSLRYDEKSTENSLFVLNPAGELTTIREEVGLSNGLGVEPESGDLFHVDTLASTIHRIPLISESGAYGPAEVFHQFASEESPDGIVVLESGEILVALWGHSALALIGKNGDEIGRVDVPPMFPTSICICNDCGILWMGSASEPREGADARILPGGVWSTPTAMRQTPSRSWRPVNMNLVGRR